MTISERTLTPDEELADIRRAESRMKSLYRRACSVDYQNRQDFTPLLELMEEVAQRQLRIGQRIIDLEDRVRQAGVNIPPVVDD